MSDVLRTSQVSAALGLLHQGDPSAKPRLIAYASDRLRSLAAAMLRGNNVGRWEQSEDLLQQALIRLNRRLEQAPPTNSRALLELAAIGMRQALIDYARSYFGPLGLGANHASDNGDCRSGTGWFVSLVSREAAPDSQLQTIEGWQQLYLAIDALPEAERQVVDLLFIHELSQAEAATVLGVSLKTVGRRWRRALLKLHDRLRDKLSGM